MWRRVLRTVVWSLVVAVALGGARDGNAQRGVEVNLDVLNRLGPPPPTLSPSQIYGDETSGASPRVTPRSELYLRPQSPSRPRHSESADRPPVPLTKSPPTEAVTKAKPDPQPAAATEAAAEPEPDSQPVAATTAASDEVAPPTETEAPQEPETAQAEPDTQAPEPETAEAELDTPAPEEPAEQVAAAPAPSEPEVPLTPSAAPPAAPSLAPSPEVTTPPIAETEVARQALGSTEPSGQGAARTEGGAVGAGAIVALPFAGEDTALDADGKNELSGLAQAMSDDESIRAQVIAFASGDGLSASKARRLSLSRALAIRSYLIENGVDSRRIDVRALGDKATDEPKNRVDVKVVGK